MTTQPTTPPAATSQTRRPKIDEILNQLVGRSRRQAAELAAILARLEQLKQEIRLHHAQLEAYDRKGLGE